MPWERRSRSKPSSAPLVSGFSLTKPSFMIKPEQEHPPNTDATEFLRTPNTVANPLATFYPRLVDHKLRFLRTTSGALSTNPTGNTNLIPRVRLGVPRVLMKIRPAHKPTPKLNPIRETEVSPTHSAFSSPDETSHEVSSCRHLGEGI